MKRLVIFGLGLACVFGLIVCNHFLPKKQFVSEGGSHSDVPGISVEVNSLNHYPDKTTLTVSWHNKTERKVTYGAMFSIERLEDGEWIDCSLKENVFVLLGYSLRKNESIKKEYLLTDMYDVSKPGTYRFCSTCSVGVGATGECSVWAEFEVE